LFSKGNNISILEHERSSSANRLLVSTALDTPAARASIRVPAHRHSSVSLTDASPNLFMKLVAGGAVFGYSGDNGPAASAAIDAAMPWVDSTGTIYFAGFSNRRIQKVSPQGIISTIGSTSAFFTVYSVLGDPSGTFLYVSDQIFIWKYIISSGIATVYAGSSSGGFSGDNGPATSAQISGPSGLWLTTAGVLYFADSANHRIRKVSAAGIMLAVAGSAIGATWAGDNGLATSASLNLPTAIYVDTMGKLFIADVNNHRIRLVQTNNIISTFSGTGVTTFNGENIPASSANLHFPQEVKGDSLGNIYIANRGNCLVRKVDSSGIISTLFGSTCGFSPGISHSLSPLNLLCGLWLDSQGNFYIADRNSLHKSFVVSSPTSQPSTQPSRQPFNRPSRQPTGQPTSQPRSNPTSQPTLQPSRQPSSQPTARPTLFPIYNMKLIAGSANQGYYGDNGPATLAAMKATGLYVDPLNGNIFCPDDSHYKIRKINQVNGIITTFAGSGIQSTNGTSGTLTSVSFYTPFSIVGDTAGTALYISDQWYVWKYVFATNIISVYAGIAQQGFSGDGGPASLAQINAPLGLWLTTSGTLYIAECYNNRIRRVTSPSRIITTKAGSSSTPGFFGENIEATLARLNNPYGVYVDTTGNLFITDYYSYLIRVVDTNNIITNFAGYSTTYNGDNLPATLASINGPVDVKGDIWGNIYITDRRDYAVRRVDTNGILTTIFGTPAIFGFSDGISPATSLLGYTVGLWIDSQSVIYFSDNNSIHRSLNLSPTSQPSNQPSTQPTGRPSHLAMNENQNLVLHNPGAETGDTSGWKLLSGITSATGWIVTNSFNCGGNRAFFTTATQASMSQNITLVPGKDYQLSVYLHGYYCIKVAVVLNNQTLLSIADPYGGCHRFQTKFLATNALAQLTMKGSVASGGTCFFDDLGVFELSNPTGQPSRQPSSQPSKQPVGGPTSQPSRVPTLQPFSSPTSQPSRTPSGQPTRQPTSIPSRQPSVQPTTQPSRQPTSRPSAQPTGQPTARPSRQPSVQPTTQPSRQPTSRPSAQPTRQPTARPSRQPSVQPNTRPSGQPSSSPSGQPTRQPTGTPSSQPTTQPTGRPTKQPLSAPTTLPSSQPSSTPSKQPISRPTGQPTLRPTSAPSKLTSRNATSRPVVQPTFLPTPLPTSQPTTRPSTQPSGRPTTFPSTQPTSVPLVRPTGHPSEQPTNRPSTQPSSRPSSHPSLQPSSCPTSVPSSQPQSRPSGQQTASPSTLPTTIPLSVPSSSPSRRPSLPPSAQPTNSPTTPPSVFRSALPSSIPSHGSTSRFTDSQTTAIPSVFPSSPPTPFPSSFAPSGQPSSVPSVLPTVQPSSQPTTVPSSVPTKIPSGAPSPQPSSFPSSQPSIQPSSTPSRSPSTRPTTFPSSQPSSRPSTCFPTSGPTVRFVLSHSPTLFSSISPSSSPSSHPSSYPSSRPSQCPSSHPSSQPSSSPSIQPTDRPSTSPSSEPTVQPTRKPSQRPTSAPSTQPTRQPTGQPVNRPSSQPSSRPSKTITVFSSSPTTLTPVFTPTFPLPTKQPSILPSYRPNSYPDFGKISVLPNTKRFQGNLFLFGISTPQPEATIQDIDLSSSDIGTVVSNQDCFIVFGQRKKIKENINLQSVNGDHNDGITVRVPSALSHERNNVVRSSAVVGDINGDGYSDMVIGYPFQSLCLVYFGSGLSGFSDLVVAFTLYGVSGSEFGWSVSDIGDLNDDKVGDMIISAKATGIVYVIFGRTDSSSDIHVDRLTSSQGFRIIGSREALITGISVASAGDFNNDGFSDILFSSLSSSASQGMIYVLLGRNKSISPSFHDIYLDHLNDTTAFTLLTPLFSFAGLSLAGVGDMNNDGFDDIAVGSLPYKGGYQTQRTYLIFGKALERSERLELSQMREGIDGIVITGGGFMVVGPGDVNNDAIPDLMIVNYPSWQGKSSSFLIHFPENNITSSPTVIPFSVPSALPSSLPSLSPTAILTTEIPSNVPTRKTTPSPSVFFYSSDPNQTRSPTQTNRPIPPPRSIRPTRSPTRSPSLSPSGIPTASTASQTPSHSSLMTTNPSTSSPSLKPSFTPTTASSSPTTYSPTTNVSSSSAEYESVYCGSSSDSSASSTCRGSLKSNANTQFIIQGKGKIRIRCDDENDYLGNKRNNENRCVFVILPDNEGEREETESVVIIEDFDIAKDILDLSQFSSGSSPAVASIQSVNEISFATSPLTLFLTASQSIILANVNEMELRDKNFIFSPSSSSSSSSGSSSSHLHEGKYAILDTSNVLQLTLLGVVVILITAAGVFLSRIGGKEGNKGRRRKNEKHENKTDYEKRLEGEIPLEEGDDHCNNNDEESPAVNEHPIQPNIEKRKKKEKEKENDNDLLDSLDSLDELFSVEEELEDEEDSSENLSDEEEENEMESSEGELDDWFFSGNEEEGEEVIENENEVEQSGNWSISNLSD
jgi:sugar lactone lactonase YvrE